MEDEKSSSATARQQIMASSSSSSTLFCYPGDTTHPNMTQTQLVSSSTHMIHSSSFESNPENNIYNNLASGIEMIGFSKTNNPTNDNNPNPVLWKGGDDPGKDPDGFYRAGPGDDDGDDGGGGYHDVVVEEEPSMRTCVFPCEGNERPSQGLSLSLSSNNPSTIGLQSFELRVHPQNPPHHHPHHHHRDYDHHNHDGYFPGKAGQNVVATHMGGGMSSITMQLEMMRSSKYLGPTQELLNEFCSLEDKKSCDDPQVKRQAKKKGKEHWEFLDGDNNHHHHEDDDDNNNHGGDGNEQGGPSSSSQSNLYGLSLLDLQKRKSKLLGLLEELDRRYRHYCEQMKGVVGSFEGMAGPGSANVYTALASKAMSRHFKSLRDAIVGQIKATKKAMGEKESVPGTTRGETPRLRILDQALRQQRAYQQMTMMEAHPWRPQRGLPERSVSILRAWLFEHFLHPYPSDVDKHILARQTGLSRSQVSNWFINARVRLWKPMVEQMYLEETKEEQEKNNMGSSSGAADHHHHHHNQSNDQIAIGGLMQPNLNDQKPTPDQLLRVEAESLSSIINSTTTAKSDRNHAQNPNELGFTNHHHHNLHQSSHFGRVEAPFGSIDIDFPSSSSFHHQHQHHGPPYGGENDNHTPHQGFGLGGSNGAGGGGNVSLTLGLQQHGGNGVTLAFSPTSQSSLFYGRDHDHDQINDCQPVHQYSLLDGDQGQNLPYRNLMGAQLLHDFA